MDAQKCNNITIWSCKLKPFYFKIHMLFILALRKLKLKKEICCDLTVSAVKRKEMQCCGWAFVVLVGADEPC